MVLLLQIADVLATAHVADCWLKSRYHVDSIDLIFKLNLIYLPKLYWSTKSKLHDLKSKLAVQVVYHLNDICHMCGNRSPMYFALRQWKRIYQLYCI